MGFFKSLFGKEETPEEKQEQKEQYNFEVLTYDGTQALRVGKVDFGIACLNRALEIKEDEDTRRTLASAYLHNDDLEVHKSNTRNSVSFAQKSHPTLSRWLKCCSN